MMWIQFDREKCTGCGACVVACMDEHNINVSSRYCSLYEGELYENGHLQVDYYVIACQHCEEAPCACVCPQKCFQRDEKTCLIILNNSECIGCGKCARVCDFHAVSFLPDRKAVKCNGCIELLNKGLIQRCIADCRVRALSSEASGSIEHSAYIKTLYHAVSTRKEKGVR